MTQGEIIEMLELEWKDRLKAAVLAERKACAKVVEVEAMQYAEPVWAIEIVNDILARP